MFIWYYIYIYIGYHMSGEVISVLSLEGRYYNCHKIMSVTKLWLDLVEILTRSWQDFERSWQDLGKIVTRLW